MDKAISRRDFIVGVEYLVRAWQQSASRDALLQMVACRRLIPTHRAPVRIRAQIVLFLRGLSKWMKGMWSARRSAMS